MCEIEISHMGNDNGNHDLVCENSLIPSVGHKFFFFISL